MTLDQSTPQSFTIPNLTSGKNYTDLLDMIGSVISGGPNVKDDVERWLHWILAGGTRPRPTKRSSFVNGDNAYAITQDMICAVLDAANVIMAWENPRHFWMIERATRPLVQSSRHVQDVQFWNERTPGWTAS